MACANVNSDQETKLGVKLRALFSRSLPYWGDKIGKRGLARYFPLMNCTRYHIIEPRSLDHKHFLSGMQGVQNPFLLKSPRPTLIITRTAIMVKKRASKYALLIPLPSNTTILTSSSAAVVTRKAGATSNPFAAPTARDAHPRTKQLRDSPSATWSNQPPFVRHPPSSIIALDISKS